MSDHMSRRVAYLERQVHGGVESGRLDARVAKLEAQLEKASEAVNRLDTNMVGFQKMARQSRQSTPRRQASSYHSMSPRDAAVCDPDSIVRKGRGEFRPASRNSETTPTRGFGSPHIALQVTADPTPSPHDSCREMRKLRDTHTHTPNYNITVEDEDDEISGRSNKIMREGIKAGRVPLSCGSNEPLSPREGDPNGFKELARRKRTHQFEIPREPRNATDILTSLPGDNQSHKLLQMAKKKGQTPYIPNSPEVDELDNIPSYVKKAVDTMPYGQSPRNFFFTSPTPSPPQDGGPVNYSQREFLQQKKRHGTPIRCRSPAAHAADESRAASPSSASHRSFMEQKKRHGTPINSRSSSHSPSAYSPAGLPEHPYPVSPSSIYSRQPSINISVAGDFISL